MPAAMGRAVATGDVSPALRACGKVPGRFRAGSGASLHRAISRLPLGYLSAVSRLSLRCTLAISRLYLGCTSVTSRLHLGYISALRASRSWPSLARRKEESAYLGGVSEGS